MDRSARFLVVVLAALGGGCGNLEFLQKHAIEEHGLSETDLLDIQYFTHGPFTLEFQRIDDKSAVGDHGVRHERERYEKYIVTDHMTPAVAVKTEGDALTVGVSDDLQLTFAPNAGDMLWGYYWLQAINDQPVEDGSIIEFRGGKHQVRFGYFDGVKSETGQRPRLLYDLKSVYRLIREKETTPGKRLPR